MKEIKVVYRKLGKFNGKGYKIEGLAWKEDMIAEVDIRLKGYDSFHSLVHEILHLQNPTWAEIKVKGHAKQLSELIWQQAYRKTEL